MPFNALYGKKSLRFSVFARKKIHQSFHPQIPQSFNRKVLQSSNPQVLQSFNTKIICANSCNLWQKNLPFSFPRIVIPAQTETQIRQIRGKKTIHQLICANSCNLWQNHEQSDQLNALQYLIWFQISQTIKKILQ